MRSFLKAAALWQAAVSAAFFIPHPHPHADADAANSNDVPTVAGSIGSEHISIHFQSACPGCFPIGENSLDLELAVEASEEECSFRGFRLNGLSLEAIRTGDVGNGQGYFHAKRSHSADEPEVYATWQMKCLQDEASLLSVNIHGLVGPDDASDPTGFTVSFQQQEPIVLRLQSTPTELSKVDAGNHDLVEAWLHPDDHQRLVVSFPDFEDVPGTPLEQEYHRLEWLKGQLFMVQQEVRHQEGKIWKVLKQDFKTCTNVKCLLQTAMTKLPDITHLLKSHFRHHPKPGSWQQNSLHLNCSRGSESFNEVSHDELDIDFVSMEAPPPPPPPPPQQPHSAEHVPPPPPPPPSEPEHEHPHPPFGKDHPRPPFGGPPGFGEDHPHPPFDGLPDFRKDQPHPPFGGPPPERPHGEHPPPPPPPPGHRPHHGPPHFHHLHHHRFRIIKGVAALVAIAIVLAFVFRSVRKRTQLFRNARRSADRAARREERRNQRAFRSAARRHQWAQWWNRYRHPFSSADYEEKRALIIEQEGVLENAMQGDISSLRAAHEIVGEMMRAEEGRARLYYQANLPPHSQRRVTPAELDAGEGGSNSSGGVPNSLSGYALPPPRYEEELEGDITVVDGFQYTPSASGATPASSVVDCSPRLSFETGRTTLTKEPRD